MWRRKHMANLRTQGTTKPSLSEKLPGRDSYNVGSFLPQEGFLTQEGDTRSKDSLPQEAWEGFVLALAQIQNKNKFFLWLNIPFLECSRSRVAWIQHNYFWNCAFAVWEMSRTNNFSCKSTLPTNTQALGILRALRNQNIQVRGWARKGDQKKWKFLECQMGTQFWNWPSQCLDKWEPKIYISPEVTFKMGFDKNNKRI